MSGIPTPRFATTRPSKSVTGGGLTAKRPRGSDSEEDGNGIKRPKPSRSPKPVGGTKAAAPSGMRKPSASAVRNNDRRPLATRNGLAARKNLNLTVASAQPTTEKAKGMFIVHSM